MADQISSDGPLTLSDHRLVWALVAVVTRIHGQSAAREAFFRDELARAYRANESANSHVRRVHDAAGRVVAAEPGSGAMIWARAEASEALSAFAEWRLGCALAEKRGEVAA